MTVYIPKMDYSSNLIAKYRFNETSGTTCIDSMGKYNGTYKGTTSVTEGDEVFRKFNGVSDYIQFNNPVIPVGKKSIKFKIRISESEKPTNLRYRILSNYSNSGFSCNIETNGHFKFHYFNNTNVAYSGGFDFKEYFDNQWHDILIVNDGTYLKIYIDDLINPISSTLVVDDSRSGNLQIGKFPPNEIEYFKGSLDEIEIYNEAIEFLKEPKFLVEQNSDYYYINHNYIKIDESSDNNQLTNLLDGYGYEDISILTKMLDNKKVPVDLEDDNINVSWEIDSNDVIDDINLIEEEDKKYVQYTCSDYKIIDQIKKNNDGKFNVVMKETI